MRVVLLVLTFAVVSLVGGLDAWAAFLRRPGCACIGAGSCSEMKNSDSSASGPECDKSELGAIICSCKAARTSRTGL